MTLHKIVIEKESLDAQYSHLHHAKVLLHLEAARLHFLEQIGYPIDHFLNNALFPVVSKISVEYLREVKEGEYQVSCDALSVGRRSLLMSQGLLNDKKKLCVRASVECMIVDGKKRMAITIDDSLREAFLRGMKQGKEEL